MTRQTKTPAQRAQDAYDVACRITERLATKYDAAAKEADQLEQELDAARVRRDYLAGHPDLPPQAPSKKSGDTPA